jgi:hypothetical protein
MTDCAAEYQNQIPRFCHLVASSEFKQWGHKALSFSLRQATQHLLLHIQCTTGDCYVLVVIFILLALLKKLFAWNVTFECDICLPS